MPLGGSLRISVGSALIALTGFLSFATSASAVPIIFSATKSAQAGNLIGIQGTNFGTGAVVMIATVNSVGMIGSYTTLTPQNSSNAFLSAQIPSGYTYGMYAVLVQDSSGNQSSVVYVNAPVITSYEYPEIDAGRTFLIYGRNLSLSGGTPAVSFKDTSGGLTTFGTVGSGDGYYMNVTAPSGLMTGHTYNVIYQNGYGSTTAEAVAPVALTIRAGGTDSFSLGVPWGSDFSSFASNSYNVMTDSRLSIHAAANGTTDDTVALQDAINIANAAGGGVVYLPAGTYLISSDLTLSSKVVLEGASQTSSIITSASTAGLGIFTAASATTTGVMNLTYQNTATITGSTFVYMLTAATGTTKMFAKNVTLNGGDWQPGGLWLANTGTNRILITGCTIENLRVDGRNIQFKGNGGSTNVTQYVYFLNNTMPNFGIGPQLGSLNTLYEGNTLNYDGDYYSYLVDTLGQTVDNYPDLQTVGGNENRINLSGPNLVILDNTFTSSGAAFIPQNDGEDILAEDPTGNFYNGSATSATSTTLTDTTQTWTTNALVAYNVVIVAGTGMGEIGTVTSNTSTTVTVGVWPVTPDSTSKHLVCRLNVPNLLVDGNTMTHKYTIMNLYQGGYNVAIVNNNATDSQDLFVRSVIETGTNVKNVLYDILVAGNTLTATSSSRPSCIDSTIDEYYNPRFGAAAFLLEIRDNNVTSYDTEAYRMVNLYQDASGSVFSNQGTSSPYAYEGIIYDGNTASQAGTVVGWTTGADGLAIANYTNSSTFRDTYDIDSRDGIWVGTPGWGGGYISLSGTNFLTFNYVLSGILSPTDMGALNMPTTMTVEGSFKTSHTGTYQGIISARNLGEALVEITNAGKLAILGNGFSGTLQSPSTVNDGNWHTFAWVSTGTTQSLYLDGSPVTTNTTYNRTGAVGDGVIGADDGGTASPFYGELAGIRVWNVARTADQVEAFKGLNLAGDEPGLTQLWRFAETSGNVTHNGVLSNQVADGLVAYWNYDDDTGTSVTDMIADNTGTISGTPDWTTGFYGFGLLLNGSTNYVSVPNNSSWAGTSGLTFHARVNIASISTDYAANGRFIISTADPSNFNNGWYLCTYALSSAPTQVGFSASRGTVGSTPIVVDGTTGLSTDQYYDVTATFNSDTKILSLYVNGTLQASEANSRALQPSTTPLIMGRDPRNPTNTAHYFNGVIDDVKVYDRCLTASEVQQLDNQ